MCELPENKNVAVTRALALKDGRHIYSIIVAHVLIVLQKVTITFYSYKQWIKRVRCAEYTIL